MPTKNTALRRNVSCQGWDYCLGGESIGLGVHREMNLFVVSAKRCFGQGEVGESLAPGQTRSVLSHWFSLVFKPHSWDETQSPWLGGKQLNIEVKNGFIHVLIECKNFPSLKGHQLSSRTPIIVDFFGCFFTFWFGFFFGVCFGGVY